jgi:hypothetical protein
MKKTFCLLGFLVALIYTGRGQNKSLNIDDWRLTADEEIEMRDRVDKCNILSRCRGEGIISDSNLVIIHAIEQKFPSSDYTITWVNMRYRRNDEDRYKRLRPNLQSKAYDVHGYLTRVVKVEKKMGSVTEKNSLFNRVLRLSFIAENTYDETKLNYAWESATYFDIATICPPPDPPCQ